MVLKVLRMTILAGLIAAGGLAMDRSQIAMGAGPAGKTADLFSNYYVPPGPCGGAAAQLYVSPRPTPPLVGHTYVTYQPLAPHEFLYKHHRVYQTCNPGAGWTRTKVSWR